MSDSKQPIKYSLKPIETQLLKVITQMQANLLSNTLSFIAIERLALTVTGDTRFEISEDMTEITVSEVEEKPAEDAGIITEPPKKGKK